MTRRLTAAMFLLAAMAIAAESRHASPFEVTAVRCWTLADTTRIAIEITGEVNVRSDRVEDPDRIFFDFVGARPSIDGKRLFSTEVGDKLLKRIRVAETVPGVTRVVLDLETAAEFSVSRLDNPSRLIIELRPVRAVPAAERTLQVTDRQPEKDHREVAVLRREAPPMLEPPRREKSVQPVTISEPPPLRPDVAKTQAARMSAKVVTTSPTVMLPEPPAPAPQQPAAAAATDDAAVSARTSSVRAV